LQLCVFFFQSVSIAYYWSGEEGGRGEGKRQRGKALHTWCYRRAGTEHEELTVAGGLIRK